MRIDTRWRLAALLFLAGAVNYLDRAAISIASPAIQSDLGLDAAQMGLVFSSFFAGYALFNFVGGWAADRYRPRNVLLAAVLAWSLLCAATALAQGFLSLLVLRALFGAAEGPFGATSAKIVSRWFPKAEVSRAIAAIASGTPIGALLAGPVVGLFFVGWGWRGTIVAVGCVGIAFGIVWLRHAPDDGSSTLGASVAKDPSIATLDRASAEPVRLRRLLHPLVIANAFAYFSYTWLLAVYLSWLPTWFTSTHHLEIGGAALRSAAPWLMGFVGIWLGAFLSDALYRRTGKPLASRLLVQVAGMATAGIGTASMGHAATAESGIVLASISLMGLYVAGTSFWTVVQDVVPQAVVGRVSGGTHLVANLGGIVGPAMTGTIVQRTGSFELAWLLAGAIAIAAAAVATSVALAARR